MPSTYPESTAMSARKVGPFVLVVDDTSLYRDTIQAVLEQNGYQTLGADNGATGLALFREHGRETIQAVVTDLQMPIMTGLQLLEAIQQLAPATKVLCISGSPAALSMVPQVPGRVVALQKKSDMNELLASLEALLKDDDSSRRWSEAQER